VVVNNGNLSYSESRYTEDPGSRPAWAKQDPTSTNKLDIMANAHSASYVEAYVGLRSETDPGKKLETLPK
jgi:hypothetical protein